MQAGLGELVGRLQQEIKGSQVGVRSMQRLMTCEGNAADVRYSACSSSVSQPAAATSNRVLTSAP